jgi:cobalt-zinc-cadmium efflux system membrane fusion protein
MNIKLDKKQAIAIAAIAAAGIVLASLILGTGKSASALSPPPRRKRMLKRKTHTATRQWGRLELTAAQSRAAGVVIATAAPGRIKTTVALPGEIRFNEDRTAHVVPRLAGVVEAVQADLGQLVKKGQVLAVIASTDLSEQRSELLAAQRGCRWPAPRMTVKKAVARENLRRTGLPAGAANMARGGDRRAERAAEAQRAGRRRGQGAPEPLRDPRALRRHGAGKHITLGEAVKEDANIFVISDLSTVWAEIAVPARTWPTCAWEAGRR